MRRAVFVFRAGAFFFEAFLAARFGADVSRLTNLQRIWKSCEALPAFAAAHPSKQPDAEA